LGAVAAEEWAWPGGFSAPSFPFFQPCGAVAVGRKFMLLCEILRDRWKNKSSGKNCSKKLHANFLNGEGSAPSLSEYPASLAPRPRQDRST